jgi:ribonuclease P protein subunit RPR2
MPVWIWWALGALAVAVLLSLPIALYLAAFAGSARVRPFALRRLEQASPAAPAASEEHADEPSHETIARDSSVTPLRRILVVDDDPALRLLLRTTLAADEFDVEEASGAREALTLARFRRPTTIILDVGLPDGDGLSLCRQLKDGQADRPPTVVLLTGADTNEREAVACGADGLLRKPFSPLELLELLDTISAGRGGAFQEPSAHDSEQLLLYARDLSRLLELERTQRRMLQQAYRQTTSALADALEAKDSRTGIHAMRVQRYALEITEAVDRSLLDDPSLEYGFLLHDIGKIAIPDAILNKPAPLDRRERELIQQHPVIGAEILEDVAILHGQGLSVVRGHHERWDGDGYPDRLAGTDIPIGARIFALADTLDAMTTDRPYRSALPWETAVDEIVAQDGRQFDPTIVRAFAQREPRVRRIFDELSGDAKSRSSALRPDRFRARQRSHRASEQRRPA